MRRMEGLFSSALWQLARCEVAAGHPLFGPEAWAALHREPTLLLKARWAPGTGEYLRRRVGASSSAP